MVENSQEYGLKYWATRSSVRLLVRSLAHFAHSLARGTVNHWMAILSVFFSIFDHSAALFFKKIEEKKRNPILDPFNHRRLLFRLSSFLFLLFFSSASLDAFSDLYEVSPSVGPSVRLSICPSFRLIVGPSLTRE